MNENSVCANCGFDISYNFCPNCGQKKYKRIDGKYIKDEFQYSILHTNKGFFYTMKNLVKNPGKTARTYIEGNRVRHYKPILLAFVLSGITTFISYKILNIGDVMDAYYQVLSETEEKNAVMNSLNSFLANYISFIMMLSIPFFSVFSFLVFRKKGLNYYEHVVANAFLYSFWAICSIFIIYPLMYIFKDSSKFIITLSFISLPLFIPLVIWFYKNLFMQLSWKKIIIRVILISILTSISYMVFSMMFGVLYMIFYQISHGR